MSRLKFSVYGNCQVTPLRQILQSSTKFSQIYEYVYINPVHLISQNEEERLHENLRNLDLFIYQPVSATYGGNSRKLGTESLLTLLKDSSQAVSFPVAHFRGYNPEHIQLMRQDSHKDFLSDSFRNCHDLNILKAYHHGMSWRECVSYIQKSGIYTSELLETNLADSLSRLTERERKIDVKISDFIEKIGANNVFSSTLPIARTQCFSMKLTRYYI